MTLSKTATLIVKKEEFPVGLVKTEQNRASGDVTYWWDAYPDTKIEKDETFTVPLEVAQNAEKLRVAAKKFIEGKLKSDKFRNHFLNHMRWAPEVRSSLIPEERGIIYERVIKETQLTLQALNTKSSLSPYEQKLRAELEHVNEALQTATFVRTEASENRVRIAAEYWTTTGQIYTKNDKLRIKGEQNFALLFHELLHRYLENIALQTTHTLPSLSSDQRSGEVSISLDYSGNDQIEYKVISKDFDSIYHYSGNSQHPYDESKWQISNTGRKSALHDEVSAYLLTCHYILFKLGITQKEMDQTTSGNPETVKKILDKFRNLNAKNRRLYSELTGGVKSPEWIASLLGAYFGYSMNEKGDVLKRNTNLHDWLVASKQYSFLSHQD